MSKKTKAKLLNGIGIGIMAVVVVLMLPLTIPKLFGYKLYGVLSGSMEPTLNKGGVVYVVEATPDEIGVGDVISYVTSSGTDIVTTHRVVEITDSGYFITKGDANNTVDAEPVRSSRLIGKAVFSVPYLGTLSSFIYTFKGACTFIMIFGVSLALWLYAGILDPAEKKEKKPSKLDTGAKITLAGIILIVGSLIGGGIFAYTYVKAESDFDDIRDEFSEMVSLDISELPVATTGANGEETKNPTKPANANTNKTEEFFTNDSAEQASDAISQLMKQYSNIVGWIQIPGTAIDYPVLHGTDDTFYLRHTYDGSWSRPGSIFLSADNNGDLDDKYNVIYGHNQNNGKMFAELLNYDQEEGFFEEHPYIYILTDDGLRTYEIFSFFYVYPTDSMYIIKYYNALEYDVLVNNMSKVSRRETGVTVSEDDDVLVLSTCNYNAKLRFVVCAKLLEDTADAE